MLDYDVFMTVSDYARQICTSNIISALRDDNAKTSDLFVFLFLKVPQAELYLCHMWFLFKIEITIEERTADFVFPNFWHSEQFINQ